MHFKNRGLHLTNASDQNYIDSNQVPNFNPFTVGLISYILNTADSNFFSLISISISTLSKNIDSQLLSDNSKCVACKGHLQ